MHSYIEHISLFFTFTSDFDCCYSYIIRSKLIEYANCIFTGLFLSLRHRFWFAWKCRIWRAQSRGFFSAAVCEWLEAQVRLSGCGGSRTHEQQRLMPICELSKQEQQGRKEKLPGGLASRWRHRRVTACPSPSLALCSTSLRLFLSCTLPQYTCTPVSVLFLWVQRAAPENQWNAGGGHGSLWLRGGGTCGWQLGLWCGGILRNWNPACAAWCCLWADAVSVVRLLGHSAGGGETSPPPNAMRLPMARPSWWFICILFKITALITISFTGLWLYLQYIRH